MAKSVPFIAASPIGEKLFSGISSVLKAAQAPVSLMKTDAKTVAGSATHILAGPLCDESTGELANKFSLSSKVTKATGTGYYPDTIYPTLDCEAVQNLYAVSNPSYSASAPTSTSAVATKEDSAVKLLELEKEAERKISAFFNNEARTSLVDTLKLACDKALVSKADKKAIVVVSKPGDASSAKFDEIVATATKSEADGRADELRAGSVSMEVTPVGSAWPKMVVFPESTQMLVCPPTAAGDEMASLFVGMAGGTGMVPQKLVGGASVYTCANAADNENPTGALLATCELLSEMGHDAEAKKILAALDKTYNTDKVLPKDLPGGKADMDTFIGAVVKNC